MHYCYLSYIHVLRIIMKRFLLFVSCLIASVSSFATHIAGGELFYERIGLGSTVNSDLYKITMRLFRQCNSSGGSGQTLDGETVRVGIYDNPSFDLNTSLLLTKEFPGLAPQISNDPNFNPCLTGDKIACYDVGTYSGQIELTRTSGGYILAWARYTRRSPLENVFSGTNTGGTFVTSIPGTNVLPNGYNSSPRFIVKDTTIVCKGSSFTLDYSALDIDADSLSYKFVAAYDGFGGNGGSNPNPFYNTTVNPIPPPPSPLQLAPLSYTSPYTASSPLGSNALINNFTGIVTGTTPTAAGLYVVCVAVEEWRNGVKINEHRKDFILKVGDCQPSNPKLGQDSRTCDGFSFNFSDSSGNSGSFTAYQWSFGDGATSSAPQPSHTYGDTGKYLIKLKITATGGCQDSSSKYVYVFPGFIPKFTITGSCYLNPYQFNSTTFTAYGTVDTTLWNFGDPTTLMDTSSLPNPTYPYATPGTYPIRLYATNTKGCQKDTIQDLIVTDKPQIQLPFKDTLICSIDTLQLLANANGGTYAWTSNPGSPNSIVNPNAQNPLVFPKDTTIFVVSVNNNGCINKDSIKVNVLNFITVDAGLDTGICRTDTFRLRPVSHALSYVWTASSGVTVSPEKYPLVQPLVTTKYYVRANLGKCQDNDSVNVKVAPYPVVVADSAGPICYGKNVQLNANIVGSTFSWSPTTNILGGNTLTPTVNPLTTTNYILTVSDTVGCPKPVRDTVTVVVIPPITAFVGRDTAVVINQPLQMFVATNAPTLSPTTYYLWTPNFALNNDTIQNPVATINITSDSIKYHVLVTTANGCIGEDDIVVKVFKTEPDIFVPTAFTPNHDGKNDILKPICVGIARLDYFRVFNRWGQLIYQTSEFEKGWDGTVGGKDQDSGTYVFMAEGVDYIGRVVFRKGTVVLIR